MDARISLYETTIGVKYAKRLVSAAQAIAESTLPAATQELVRLRASQINGCGACTDMHTKDAAHAGESQLRINLVATWREATVFTEAERAALELSEQGTRIADAAGGVTDEAWANAAQHYDAEQLGALVALIADINTWNRLNVITRQPAGDYQPGQKGFLVRRRARALGCPPEVPAVGDREEALELPEVQEDDRATRDVGTSAFTSVLPMERTPGHLLRRAQRGVMPGHRLGVVGHMRGDLAGSVLVIGRCLVGDATSAISSSVMARQTGGHRATTIPASRLCGGEVGGDGRGHAGPERGPWPPTRRLRGGCVGPRLTTSAARSMPSVVSASQGAITRAVPAWRGQGPAAERSRSRSGPEVGARHTDRLEQLLAGERAPAAGRPRAG